MHIEDIGQLYFLNGEGNRTNMEVSFHYIGNGKMSTLVYCNKVCIYIVVPKAMTKKTIQSDISKILNKSKWDSK